MAREIRLALIWHMHQPDYRDPATGVHLLPWVNLHAARGYTDVARVSERFPHFKQTINFSPVLLNQTTALASDPTRCYFYELSRKSAEDLTDYEKDFILRHCFFINWDVHVRPHQRYNQLLMKRGTEIAGLDLQYARARFTRSDFRDVVVLFNLAWCGFTLRSDSIIATLIRKEQGYTEEDKFVLLGKIQDALKQVIPRHGRLGAKGLLELTCCPYYHPILPLIVDSRVRPDHHPDTPPFKYPEDARRQLSMGLSEFEKTFGHRPRGMWPSEGSISQDAVELIQDAGLRWIAADEALLLDPSTGTKVPEKPDIGRPWLIGRPDGPPLACCFRNRGLSDDIGFQYSWKPPKEAVKLFVGHLEDIAKRGEKDGPPPLVTIVCDGENPWEHYSDSGEGFLVGLAQALENHPLITLTTPSEYLADFPPAGRIDKIGAGSWIGGNFDIWIGCDEDRAAWKILANARKILDETLPVPEGAEDEIGTEERRKALEQLWVAEGSDWFWWYGEPFHSPLDYLFDILFRRRLSRAYELMGLEAPAEILVPVDPKLPVDNVAVDAPLDVIHPEIDGKITTFYEWSGAGHLKASLLEGLVAREKPGPITDLYFSADTENLYLRVDFDRELLEPGDLLAVRILKPMETNLAVDLDKSQQAQLRLYRPDPGKQSYHIETLQSAAVDEVAELSIPVVSLGAGPRSTISLACFVMRGKSRVDRCPLFGTVSVTVPDERYLASLWRE